VVSSVYSTYGWGRVATSYNELIIVAHVVNWLWPCDIELIEVQPEISIECYSLMTENSKCNNRYKFTLSLRQEFAVHDNLFQN
jgi:hypothetical protein